MEVNLENKQPSGHYERTDLLLPTFNRMAIKRYSSPTRVELRLQNFFLLSLRYLLLCTREDLFILISEF